MSALTVNPVLVDLLPGQRLRDALVIAGGTAFVAIASQVVIPLWFTPVPLSLATFAVLLTGAALGPARAAVALGLYVVLGLMGAPVFAGFASGWAFASFGYILGYLVAATVVGYFARQRADRHVVGTAATVIAATGLVYAAGVPWLMAYLGVDFATALGLGVYPFVVGDVLKAVAAAALLPAAWKLVGDPAALR